MKRIFARLFGVPDSTPVVSSRPVAGAGALPSIESVEPVAEAPVVLPEVFDELRVEARVIRAGAFEFLAESSIGELRGRLVDPEYEPAEGALLTVVIPAGAWKVDTMSPEENAFAGELVGEPGVSLLFRAQGGVSWRIPMAVVPEDYEPGDLVYAWVFPEDVVGCAAVAEL